MVLWTWGTVSHGGSNDRSYTVLGASHVPVLGERRDVGFDWRVLRHSPAVPRSGMVVQLRDREYREEAALECFAE